MTPPTVTLPSGDELPMVGVGTWDIDGDTVQESVRAGLDAGYAHVDTAEGYRNEAEIGEALADYDREDVFLTSKVLPKHLDYESVIEPARRRSTASGLTISTCISSTGQTPLSLSARR